MYIQKEPICVYCFADGRFVDSYLYFHTDHKDLLFEEFLLNIVLPKVEVLQLRGYTVQWGYVNATPERDLNDYKNFLEKEIRYEKQGDSPTN